ncbi:hypothetical protein K1T71_011563 [Dendrolimus kikuchii]|uniref:Uncharacterized protein n=1 Tax=Dendrolimus kikuchii TaxID=765133 RepID=A0ACC1CP96_9NEOP|nr:hypothetical protein K1T71_011563 [Dendrolimus kikuchii]
MSITELVLSASWFGDEHIPVLVAKKLPLQTLELWKYLNLSPSQINELQTHSSLEMLRCLNEKISSENTNNKESWKSDHDLVLRRTIHIIPSDARFPRKYFRSGSEGFRGSLFYFWTRSKELVPLAAGARPSLEDEEDVFY